MELVLAERTREQLAMLLRARPQSIGIVAPTGAGKSVVARYLAAELLGVTAEELENYPYFYALEPEPKKESSSVEAVRNLLPHMSRTVPGNHPTRRVMLVEHADKLLRPDSQNVLLKFIEEPPADTAVILTYASETSLLPTVRSRLQPLSVQLPAREQLAEHFAQQGYKSVDIAKAHSLSGGLPGMMTALLAGDQDHPLLTAVELAKRILAGDIFQRLAMVDELAKADLSDLFFAFRQIARASMSAAASKAGGERVIARWAHIYSLAGQAEEWRGGHVQTKLLLTNFLLQL